MSKTSRTKVCHKCCACGNVYVRRDHLIVHMSDIYKCGAGEESLKLLISMKASVALLDMCYRYNMRGTEPPMLLRLYVADMRSQERIKYLENELIVLQKSLTDMKNASDTCTPPE